MNLYEKLLNIQSKLKAPKGQFNKFGNYKYRSCEDILEALKPLLYELHQISLMMIEEADRFEEAEEDLRTLRADATMGI